ncbi:hypothetical protein D3C71_1763550 [compost metagenome]
MEVLDVADQMIRRQHQQQRIIAIAACFQRCRGDGRGCVAANRLQQDRRWRRAHLLQLLGGNKAVRFVGHHNGWQRGHTGNAQPGGLQHAVCPG